LNNGKLFGVSVTGLTTETSASIPSPGSAFTLVDLGSVQNLTGTTLNTNSSNLGVTTFLRPEDGAWDPINPSDFYFNTTNAFASPTRLWKLHFSDINNPELGGTITAVLDGTEGQKMLDNMTIDKYGHILLVEDVGNNAHVGKVWQYNIATDKLTQIAQHDSTRFLSGGANFLTQDEEASGIIDVQEILGPGMFLIDVQAHNAIAGEAVEGGQLLAFYNPNTYNANPEVAVQGNSINIVDGDITPDNTDNTDFGSVSTGSTITKVFSIKNDGPGNLLVTGININGTNASEFSLVSAPTFPLTIAANNNQSITVQFAPISTGNRNATLTISNNDINEAKYDFAVLGIATVPLVPEINVQGNSIDIADGDITASTTDNTDFGSITTGSNQTKIFTIQNPGTASLSISGISFTGTNATEFSLVSAPTFPLSIAASGSQVITVKFAPLVVGNRSATITIASDDADEASYDFALQGNATAPLVPEINVQGNSIDIADGDVTASTSDNTDFGSVNTGSNQTKSFTIQNPGTASLSISGISFTGTNATEFSLVSAPTFPLSIAASGSQVVTVQFAPTAIGTRNATITIASNDADEASYDFSLQGTGTTPTGIENPIASYFELYPNPTDENVTISLMLDKNEHFVINVLDLQGKEAILSLEKDLTKGENKLSLLTSNLSNGTYLVQINSDSFTKVIKLVIIK